MRLIRGNVSSTLKNMRGGGPILLADRNISPKNPSNSGILYPKLSGGLSEKEGKTESLKAQAKHT